MDRREFAKQLNTTILPADLPPDEQTRRIELLRKTAEDLLPKHLYRFRSCSDLSFSAFDNDELWVSTADCMNDGFDTRIYLDQNEIHEQIKELIGKWKDRDSVISNIPDLSNYPPQLSQAKELFLNLPKEEIERIMNAITKWIADDTAKALQELSSAGQKTLKFCCFSESVCSPSMWGIYASDESGFALEYDFSYMPYALSPDERFTRDCSLYPVVYDEQRFQVPTNYAIFLIQYRLFMQAFVYSGLYTSDSQFVKDFMASGICPDLLMATKISLHKSNEWARETEWRLFCTSSNDTVFQNEKHSCCIKRPTAIYLGRRIKPIHEKILKNIADEKSLPVYKMMMDDSSTSYELKYV